MKRYSYNHDYKPSLVDAVRRVLMASETPLTSAEIVRQVEAYDIASWDTKTAVTIALRRLRINGETIVEAELTKGVTRGTS